MKGAAAGAVGGHKGHLSQLWRGVDWEGGEGVQGPMHAILLCACLRMRVVLRGPCVEEMHMRWTGGRRIGRPNRASNCYASFERETRVEQMRT